jgi:hypothetical protein
MACAERRRRQHGGGVSTVANERAAMPTATGDDVRARALH